MFISDYKGKNFTQGGEAKFKMENLQGHVKELYVLDYVQFPYQFSEYKSFDSVNRFPCRTSNNYYTEPGYICSGCSNGVYFADEAPQTCDDGNTNDGDGCSSACTNEYLYTCLVNEIGISQ